MTARRSAGPLLLALILAVATACEDDPVAPIDDDEEELPVSAPLPVVGHGQVPERYTAEVAIHGSWAYTSSWSNRGGNPGNKVVVWNIAGDEPVATDSLIVPFASTTGDVQVSDDGQLLMVATERTGGSVMLYDLQANAARPPLITRYNSEATNPGVHTAKFGRVGGTLYAFLSIDPLNTFPEPVAAALVILDLSDPANPVEVLVRTMGQPFVHDVFVRDGILFTALWDAGLTLWDIGGGELGGTPADPVELGNVLTEGGNVHNVWWYHDALTGQKRYAFVGEEEVGGSIGFSSGGDLHVVDVSDMANPVEVAFYHVPGAGAHNFDLDEENGVLYAAFYNGGVRALDVRGDLSACSAQQRAADGRCNLTLMEREAGVGLSDVSPVAVWGVQHRGTRVWASDMVSGLYVLDVSTLQR
ncbi:MAG: hypothetical protein WEB88_16315 [Gemmatimonadota bacterium]